MRNFETNAEVEAKELKIGDLLFDPAKTGTHQNRVEVQWIGRHVPRARIYVAGVEENSRNPVTLAYNAVETVKVFRS